MPCTFVLLNEGLRWVWNYALKVGLISIHLVKLSACVGSSRRNPWKEVIFCGNNLIKSKYAASFKRSSLVCQCFTLLMGNTRSVCLFWIDANKQVINTMQTSSGYLLLGTCYCKHSMVECSSWEPDKNECLWK